jgi:hypothetical protein
VKNGDKKYSNIFFKEKIEYRLLFEKGCFFLTEKQLEKEEKI